MKKLSVPHCIKGTEGWKLNERIAEALEGKDYLKWEFSLSDFDKSLRRIA